MDINKIAEIAIKDSMSAEYLREYTDYDCSKINRRCVDCVFYKICGLSVKNGGSIRDAVDSVITYLKITGNEAGVTSETEHNKIIDYFVDTYNIAIRGNKIKFIHLNSVIVLESEELIELYRKTWYNEEYHTIRESLSEADVKRFYDCKISNVEVIPYTPYWIR